MYFYSREGVYSTLYRKFIENIRNYDKVDYKYRIEMEDRTNEKTQIKHIALPGREKSRGKMRYK